MLRSSDFNAAAWSLATAANTALLALLCTTATVATSTSASAVVTPSLLLTVPLGFAAADAVYVAARHHSADGLKRLPSFLPSWILSGVVHSWYCSTHNDPTWCC